LWAGLPVLTCRGDTFAGRIAASLLQSVGLPELITSSLADYAALALWLAQEPALLGEIRNRLAKPARLPAVRHRPVAPAHRDRLYGDVAAMAARREPEELQGRARPRPGRRA
jgi:hypothetical protein